MHKFSKKFRFYGKPIILIILAAVLGLAWYWYYPAGSWRYEVTITVDTPEGVKTGSAIHEISNSKGLFGFPDAGNPADIKGEAVVVDLGERGVLFGLISQGLTRTFYQMFPVPMGHGGSTREGIRYYRNIETGLTHETNCRDPKPGCMRMVTFEDLNDPTSVKSVDPRDLSATFGDGVRLQDIRYITTDESIEWRVRQYLPWIDHYYNKLFDGDTVHRSDAKNRLANSLGAGSFTTRRNN